MMVTGPGESGDRRWRQVRGVLGDLGGRRGRLLVGRHLQFARPGRAVGISRVEGLVDDRGMAFQVSDTTG